MRAAARSAPQSLALAQLQPTQAQPRQQQPRQQQRQRPCLLLLLCHAALAPPPARTCRWSTCTTRFWVGASGAGGVGIVDCGTNASCSAAFLGNLTRHQAAVSSLGFEVWSLGSSGSQPRVAYNDGSTFDPGLAACVKQLAASFRPGRLRRGPRGIHGRRRLRRR